MITKMISFIKIYLTNWHSSQCKSNINKINLIKYKQIQWKIKWIIIIQMQIKILLIR